MRCHNIGGHYHYSGTDKTAESALYKIQVASWQSGLLDRQGSHNSEASRQTMSGPCLLQEHCHHGGRSSQAPRDREWAMTSYRQVFEVQRDRCWANVTIPCSAVCHLPFPAASVCSRARNAGAVSLCSPLQCLSLGGDMERFEWVKEDGRGVASAREKLDLNCLRLVRPSSTQMPAQRRGSGLNGSPIFWDTATENLAGSPSTQRNALLSKKHFLSD